jgi:DNA-binding transcriptional ArsR family regulator
MKDSLDVNGEQLQALGNETRQRLYHFLSEGELTESEAAEKLGVRAGSVYYHMHRLLQVGLIEQVGARHHAKKPQAVYRSVAKTLNFNIDFSSKAMKESLASEVKTVARLAAREFGMTLRDAEPGQEPQFIMLRHRIGLTSENCRELRSVVTETLERLEAKEGEPVGVATFLFSPRTSKRIVSQGD